MVRYWLKEGQFERIESLLPGKHSDPGRTAGNNRLFVEAVLWIARTGAPWRDLPPEFGLWNSAYQRFSRWSRQGIWHRVFAQLAGDAAQALGGRTMVLTTTLRALRTIGDALQERFGASGELEVLVQGNLPKRLLMERFRRAGQGSAPGCVLVASASFWEGVDLPGEALQLVVIDKLPFPPPGDPLVEARCRKLETEGRSAFADHSVPEAAVALKQGAGRLIRRETDTGLLVICDNRLTKMGYGRRLLAALPPMRRLASAVEFDAALQALRDTASQPVSMATELE